MLFYKEVTRYIIKKLLLTLLALIMCASVVLTACSDAPEDDGAVDEAPDDGETPDGVPAESEGLEYTLSNDKTYYLSAV